MLIDIIEKITIKRKTQISKAIFSSLYSPLLHNNLWPCETDTFDPGSTRVYWLGLNLFYVGLKQHERFMAACCLWLCSCTSYCLPTSSGHILSLLEHPKHYTVVGTWTEMVIPPIIKISNFYQCSTSIFGLPLLCNRCISSHIAVPHHAGM